MIVYYSIISNTFFQTHITVASKRPDGISENTGKFLLSDLAALTNSIYFNSQHGALLNRFPVRMTPIGWREFPTIFWSVPDYWFHFLKTLNSSACQDFRTGTKLLLVWDFLALPSSIDLSNFDVGCFMKNCILISSIFCVWILQRLNRCNRIGEPPWRLVGRCHFPVSYGPGKRHLCRCVILSQTKNNEKVLLKYQTILVFHEKKSSIIFAMHLSKYPVGEITFLNCSHW